MHRSRVIWTCVCGVAAAAYLAAQHELPKRRQADFHTAIAVTQAHLYGTTGLMARADRTSPGADVLLIVSEGKWDVVRSRVVARGFPIRFEDHRSGYLRVTVPLEAIRLFFEWPEIAASRVDGLGAYDTRLQPQDLPTSLMFSADGTPFPRSTRSEAKPPDRPPLTRDVAQSYPYNSDQDMGVTEFRAKNPMFDGRGVGIGAIDGTTWVALDQPEFSTARALDGSPRRKVLRYLDHPGLRRLGSSAPFSDWFDCQGAICEVQGLMMRLPSPGRYRLAELMLKGVEVGRGRNGFMKYIAVQRQDTGRIYIDTDGDLDFIPENALVDFNDQAWNLSSVATLLYLGGPPLKAVVTVDASGTFLWVHPFTGGHVTPMAAVAAGSDTGTNLGVGVAPNASLVHIDSGPRATLVSHEVEGLITIARDKDVDVIYASIIVQTPLGTSDSFDSVAFDRISEAYNKPVLVSAGNYPFALSASPAAGSRVAMTVAQYVSEASYEARYGMKRAAAPIQASTVGPALDGSAKPLFVAATIRVTARPCDEGFSTTAQNMFAMPRCYGISGGTSSASPSAAGVVALLLSAAKQRHLSPSVAQIREALIASARLMRGYPAHMQGVGLINVQRAWEHLQRQAAQPVVDIEGELRHPFVGVLGDVRPKGLYVIASSGDKQAMGLTIRTDPRSGIDVLAVRHEGGVDLSVPENVTLQGSGVTRVPVTLAPPEVGRVGSSWVTFARKMRDEILGRALVTAARPAPLTPPSYRFAWSDEIELDSHRDVLVSVSPGTTGLLIEADLLQGDGRVFVSNPWAMPLFPQAFWSTGAGFYNPAEVRTVHHAGVAMNPAPGAWRFTSTDRASVRPEAVERNERTLVSVKTTAFRTTCDMVARELNESRDHIRVVINDLFAKPVNGGALAAPASVQRASVTLEDEFTRRPIEIVVKPNTAVLQIAARQRVGDGIVLQLFSCTLGHCIAITQSVPGEESPILNVRQPAAGEWKVFAVPIRPLYKASTVDVTVTQALEADLAPLTQAPVKNGSETSPVFEGDIPRSTDSRGLMVLRTDERAKINKDGWGAVSICTVHDSSRSR